MGFYLEDYYFFGLFILGYYANNINGAADEPLEVLASPSEKS